MRTRWFLAFLALCLISISLFAQASSSGTGRIVYALNCVCSQLRAVMPPLSMLLVVLAAVIYGVGKIFGSELGQKTSGMAAFMLVAAILSVVLAVAGPDIMRMLYNDPAMAIACEASACAAEQPVKLAPAPAPFSPNLRCGQTITIPNREYLLSGDISSAEGGSCISVEADNVTINCHGYWISSRSRADGAGQYGISTNSSNTTIRNCGIRDYGYGILLAAAQNASLINNTLQSTILGGMGIFIGQGRNGYGSSYGAHVENNTILGQSAALHIEYSSSCTLYNNSLSSDENSLTLLSAENNVISSNSVSSQKGAAALMGAGSNNNMLFDNNIKSNADAVRIIDSYLNTLDKNTFAASSDGISLYLSSEPGVMAENTISRNFFSSGGHYIVNDGTSNYFNMAQDGRSMGNHYAGIDTSKYTDSDADGYADGGSAYPYNSKNSNGKWLGEGADWGPIMER